jgi:hypothetical protein
MVEEARSAQRELPAVSFWLILIRIQASNPDASAQSTRDQVQRTAYIFERLAESYARLRGNTYAV